MQCKDCEWWWRDGNNALITCHYDDAVKEYGEGFEPAPCQDSNDVSPIEELLLEDAIKSNGNMVETSVKEGSKNMYDLKEIIKEKIKDVARYIDIDDMIAELVDDCITSSMVEYALKEKLRDYVGDVADDLMDEALDEYIDEELE